MVVKSVHYTAKSVDVMGKVAIGLAAPAFLMVNYKWYISGATSEAGELLASVALAFTGLVAIAASRVLRDLERRLQSLEKNI